MRVTPEEYEVLRLALEEYDEELKTSDPAAGGVGARLDGIAYRDSPEYARGLLLWAASVGPSATEDRPIDWALHLLWAAHRLLVTKRGYKDLHIDTALREALKSFGATVSAEK